MNAPTADNCKSPMGCPDHVVLKLPVGDRILEIEQTANLANLARKSVLAGTDPYWAYLWPSARALVNFVATHDLSGLEVLEIGAGLGAPGLAAALRGASVTLSDLRRNAVDRARQNAARNHLDVQVSVIDWSAPPVGLPRFDRILASDVLYKDGMLRSVLRFARAHLTDHGALWLTDPMRIPETGIRGAATLCGFEVQATVAVSGQTLTGGVTLFEIQRRQRGVRPTGPSTAL